MSDFPTSPPRPVGSRDALYRGEDGTTSRATIYRAVDSRGRITTWTGWRQPQKVETLPDRYTVDLLVHHPAGDHWVYMVPWGTNAGQWCWPHEVDR